MAHMSTLSKVGLAGLRVGYCIADPQLALALHKVRPPFNISQTSLALAETILTRFAEAQAEMIRKTIANRDRLSAILTHLPQAQVLPSSGNLVLVRLPDRDRAQAVCQHLARHRILVKDVSSVPLLEGCLRVSIGSSADLDQLEQAVAAYS
jgi:histidinol-phosphate/aromatic aminotransferase/cobyric acid decarboxylase-like protein